MPWNITASARGSSIARGGRTPSVLGGLQAGFPSTGGPSSFGMPLALGGPSRQVSASPLTRVRRGSAVPSLGPGLGLDDTQTGDFEFGRPAVGADTQTQTQSQWAKNALDADSFNFLAFVETSIATKTAGAETQEIEEGEAADQITFEELLPTTSSSRLVACQGLMQVLNLATKGLMSVRQERHLGDIWMSVVAQVA